MPNRLVGTHWQAWEGYRGATYAPKKAGSSWGAADSIAPISCSSAVICCSVICTGIYSLYL